MSELLGKRGDNRSPEDWASFSPEMALISFEMDNEQVVLKSGRLFERGPELQPDESDDMFLTVHDPRLTTPALFDFLDELFWDEEALAS